MQDRDATIVSWTWRDGRTVVLRPRGELHCERARVAMAVIRRAMAQSDRRAIVDLSEVTFLDDETARLLHDHSDANVMGSSLQLRGASGLVQQRLDVCARKQVQDDCD